jgi:hypothetical protein
VKDKLVSNFQWEFDAINMQLCYYLLWNKENMNVAHSLNTSMNHCSITFTLLL